MEVHERELSVNPHNHFRSEYPFDEADWLDPDDGELVAELATHASLRGRPFAIPEPTAYHQMGIQLLSPPRIHVLELCRAAAELRREDVLATAGERRFNIPFEFVEVLVLNEWKHPDKECPSRCEAFHQLAQVLVTGSSAHYNPSSPPNTHWSNWPSGGSL